MFGRILSSRALQSAFNRIKRFNYIQKQNASSDAGSAVIQYKQDLPPPGGYKPFDWERIPSEKPLMGSAQIFIVLCIMIYGYYALQWERRRYRFQALEQLDAKIAISPLLLAERDRLLLKRLRRNFEEECRIMKDVPGWEVGKWFDVPMFKTLPEGMWIEPQSWEFWIHAEPELYEKWARWWWQA